LQGSLHSLSQCLPGAVRTHCRFAQRHTQRTPDLRGDVVLPFLRRGRGQAPRLPPKRNSRESGTSEHLHDAAKKPSTHTPPF
jgi:hypothetical protein